MSYLQRAREVLDVECESLAHVRDALDETFDKAVEVLLGCLKRHGKIVVTGIGKSLHIAEKISATLASTGSTSVVLNPTQAVHGDLGILCKDDALLAISYSGESEELTSLIPLVKRVGLSVVAITGHSDSTLGRNSDAVISVTVAREACPFNMAPTSSTTVSLAVGDALAMVLLEARGFKKEDYAKLHPCGAIGRALLLRVADIMRKGDALASVAADAAVRDAVVAMTRARAGSVGIVDGAGKLVGILTDGDLRRHLSEGGSLLDRPATQIMTPSPVVVHETQLAVDVLRVFEKHRIDDIPVVDEQMRLVGSIDIQDLPKLKIL